jgi:tetratricopeptide (TPR) repeat protein
MTNRERAWQNVHALSSERQTSVLTELEQRADRILQDGILDDEVWISSAANALWLCGLGHKAERLLTCASEQLPFESAIRILTTCSMGRDIFSEATLLSLHRDPAPIISRLSSWTEMDALFSVHHHLLVKYHASDKEDHVHHLEMMHNRYPERLDLIIGKAREYFSKGEYKKVIEILKDRVHESKYGIAYLISSIAYLRVGDIASSESLLKIISTNGYMQEVHPAELSFHAQELQRIKRAIERLKRLNPVADRNWVAGCVLTEGSLLRQRGGLSHLAEILPDIVKKASKLPLVLGFSATVCEDIGDRSEARRLYVEAFNAADADGGLTHERAHWCDRVSSLCILSLEFEAAESWARQAHVCEPTEARFLQLAQILERRNNFGEALSIYERVDGTREQQGHDISDAVLGGLLRSAHALAAQKNAPAPHTRRLAEADVGRRVIRAIFGFGPVPDLAFHSDRTVFDEIWVVDFLTGRVYGSETQVGARELFLRGVRETVASSEAVAAERPHAGSLGRLLVHLQTFVDCLKNSLRPQDIVVFSSSNEWLRPDIVRRAILDIDAGAIGQALTLKYRPFRPNVIQVGRDSSKGPFIVRASKLAEAGAAILRFLPPPTIASRPENAGLHVPLFGDPEQMVLFSCHEIGYRRFRQGKSVKFWEDMFGELKSGTAEVPSFGHFIVIPREACSLPGLEEAEITRQMIDLDPASAIRAYAAYLKAKVPSS